MENVVIVIPIYKLILSKQEEASLRQCFTILGRYDICFVTHNNLKTSYYKSIISQYNINVSFAYFPEEWFSGIAGYNRLCMGRELYETFEQYEYMLIYQPDAWVFRDELKEWCAKGYDYIGAPWSKPEVFHGTPIWVGNGGLSLRRVKAFIRPFRNSNKKIFSAATLYQDVNWHKPRTIVTFLLKLAGYKNNFKSLHSYFEQFGTAEDMFWCCALSNTCFRLKIPAKEEARMFAFEMNPHKEFEQNSNILPFGCHAFMKYSFKDFWSRYIKI